MEKTQNQLGKIKNSTHGTIALGVTETCGASILSGLIGDFHHQYPNIRYSVLVRKWGRDQGKTGKGPGGHRHRPRAL